MHTDDKMLCVTAPFYYFKKNIMSTRKPISMYLVNKRYAREFIHIRLPTLQSRKMKTSNDS